jgi:ATP/maltotriose-dependent transcriptional regulator MalT
VLFRLLGPLLEELVLDLSHQRELEQLSPSELRVLALVAHGASNREVSARLSLSVATVRKHLEHVYRKLGVCNRTAAVARAFPHSIS